MKQHEFFNQNQWKQSIGKFKRRFIKQNTANPSSQILSIQYAMEYESRIVVYVNRSLVFTPDKTFWIYVCHRILIRIGIGICIENIWVIRFRWEKEVNKWKAMHLNNQLNKLKFLEEYLLDCWSRLGSARSGPAWLGSTGRVVHIGAYACAQ